MNDHDDFDTDPLAQELRASLHRHADQAPRGDFLAERIVAAADQAGAAARPRARRWALPLLAGLGAAVAVVMVVTTALALVHLLQPSPKHFQKAAVSPANRPSPTPTTTAPTTSAPQHTDLNQVRILDVTFAYGKSWALASAQCTTHPADRCIALLRSADGGRNWHSVPNPAANVAGVQNCAQPCIAHLRFVNRSTGYAFGPTAMFMTTDGGASWAQLPGGAEALESLNDDVIRVSRAPSGRVHVSTAAIGSRHWTKVPFDDTADGVALNRGQHADYLLLTRASGPSTLYLSRDTGQTWSSLGEPCPTGHALSVAAGNDSGVSVLCKAPDDSRLVATSTDFGADFTAGDPVPTSADFLAGDPSTVLLAGGDGLSRSTSGGRGWTQIAQVTGTLSFVGTESETKATAVSADGRTIWRTHDGGRHWTAVSLG